MNGHTEERRRNDPALYREVGKLITTLHPERSLRYACRWVLIAAVAALSTPVIGHTAPWGFTLYETPRPIADLRFEDGNGRAVSLADFRGKLVLLNIWATWCAPCRREMPTLDRLQAELGGPEFEVVALSIDRKGLEVVSAFYAEIGISRLAAYVDGSGKAAGALGIRGMPTTLLIDQDGRELGRLVGPAEWDSTEMVDFIRAQLLPRSGASRPGALSTPKATGTVGAKRVHSHESRKQRPTRKQTMWSKIVAYVLGEPRLVDREKYLQPLDRSAPDFTLQDADRRPVRLADYRDKVVVLHFIYNNCPDVCPLHAKRIAEVQEMVNQTPMKDRVQFISVTTDPENDTPKVLRDYGPAHGFDPANWIFLTSDPDRPAMTRELAKRYGHKFTKLEDGYQLHGVVTHVIDKGGRWRANFHGLKFQPTNLVLFLNALVKGVNDPRGQGDRDFWDKVRELF